MDFFVVLIFLCLFTAQAACRPTEDEKCTDAMVASLRMVILTIEKLLNKTNESEELPNTSCPPRNNSESPTAHQLSSSFCKMMKLSEQIPELKEISQNINILARSLTSSTARQNCTLPSFAQEMDIYLYAKCQLESLKQQLSKICPSH